MNPGQPKYTLRITAQLVGLSPRTLRLYEEAGLIEPARVDGRRQRMYSDQDLRWLRCIRDLIHDKGLTVAGIRRLLDLIPCSAIRHCDPQQSAECRPHQRVPGMPAEAPGDRQVAVGTESRRGHEAAAERDEAGVEVKLVYGVEELGAVLHCSRCLTAERAARRAALAYPGQATVSVHDVHSQVARDYGITMTPSIIVGDLIIATGRGASEDRIRSAIEVQLAEVGNRREASE